MEPGTGGRYGWVRGNFLLLAISSSLFVMSGYLLVPMLSPYLTGMGIVEYDVGFIVGMFNLAAVFSCIPIGRFIDRYGRRLMLVLGITIQALVPFLYTICTDYTHFILVRILHGFGFAAFLVTSHTMIVDLAPKGHLGQVVGIFSICSLAARALGPALSGFVTSYIGNTNLFYMAGAIGIVAAVVAFNVKVPPLVQSEKGQDSFLSVLRNRNLITASLIIAIVMIPQGVVNSFFPIYALGLGVGAVGVGLYFTVYAVCTAIIRPFTGALSDRIGRVAVAVPFSLLIALGIASFSADSDLTGFLITAMLLGLGVGAALPVLTALSVDTIKPRMRGQAIAISSTAIDVGIFAGAMSMGPVAMWAGYQSAFVITGIVVLGGTIAFLVIRRVWKKEEKVYT